MLEFASDLLALLKRSAPISAPIHRDGKEPSLDVKLAGHFSESNLIGQWKGLEPSRYGCNDLNRWEVCYKPVTPLVGAVVRAGFETYLAHIHPNDIQKELNGMKRQIITQSSRGHALLKIRNRHHEWLEVIAHRQFSYCQYNGELLKLEIGLFTPPPVSSKTGNSQNL